MCAAPPKVQVLSTFNVTGFCNLGRNHTAEPSLAFEPAPLSLLYTEDSAPAASDYALVWTQPEMVLPAFSSFLETRQANPEAIEAEVDAYADALCRLARRFKIVLAPTWVAAPWLREPRLIELSPQSGVAYWLARMNLRLADRLSGHAGVRLLDCSLWTESAGKLAFSSKLWHMAKVPFGDEVFKSAIRTLKSALGAWLGLSRKLIILDLDGTLWGGILGEVGLEGLNLGGHDAQGEAFARFQRDLKRLSQRGILLAIASKNDASTALAAIDQHPEMILRSADFAAHRINWNDKASNIAEMLQELNLPPSAAVFIDDNPAERDRVAAALPRVLTPNWPADPLAYVEALAALGCFETASITQDDLRRTDLYQQSRKALETRDSGVSFDDWVASLAQTVTVQSATGPNQQRALQLLNKTNQMNLATRRLTEAEFDRFLGQADSLTRVFRVRDKFGDAGLTGLASLTFTDETALVTDFLLSCRVMGRRIEDVMLHTMAREAFARGATTLRASLNPTGRNEPCRQFWASRPGVQHDPDSNSFTLPVSSALQPPPGIQVDSDTL